MKNLSKIMTLGFIFLLFSCSDEEPMDEINEVNADFSANPTTVDEGVEVNYTDQSTGNPVSWMWTFDGGDPATSMEQNPVVKYPNSGVYDVTLTVENMDTRDTETKSDYINVSEREIPEEYNIVGTWERVESNYEPLNGMQVTVYEDEEEGIVIYTPSSSYMEDDIKWRSIEKLSEHEYVFEDRFTDGNYAESSIFILAYGNELIIGNFNESDAGSFQRWERIDFQYPEDEDYSLAYTWERTKSNNPPLDGMKVEVNMDETTGTITLTPDSDDFPLDAIKWKDIQKEGANRFAFEDLVSDGSYGEARLFIVGKGSEVIIGAFSTNYGSFQRWSKE
jgi:PKD repeat protein